MASRFSNSDCVLEIKCSGGFAVIKSAEKRQGYDEASEQATRRGCRAEFTNYAAERDRRADIGTCEELPRGWRASCRVATDRTNDSQKVPKLAF